MQPTSDERRKVAKEMREYDVAGFKESAIVPFLECLGYAYKDWRGILDGLADLIDRPAIKPEPSGRAYWRCPRCGAFNYRSAVTDCCGVIPAHYCANCGAEVVK